MNVIHKLIVVIVMLAMITVNYSQVFAQGSQSPVSTGNEPLRLTMEQKLGHFGSVELFIEDSLLRRWRKEELKKVENLDYAKHVYSSSLSKYVEIYPTDTAEITRRFIVQLKEASSITPIQEVMIKQKIKALSRSLGEGDSYFKLLVMVQDNVVFSTLPAEQYGRYLKNKSQRLNWLVNVAVTTLFLHYSRDLHLNESQKLVELRKLVEASKPR